MFIRIPIDKIDDNPYQTRIEHGDIAELADSILKMQASRPGTSGLIQVPPARLLDDGKPTDPFVYEGEMAELIEAGMLTVELAAGHRRLRAFRQLASVQGDGEYGTFPVDVQALDDQAMADIAWEENAKRKDLSAIEEARTLERAIEQFGWTQAEVGERWGLSQSAVANKLRLLRLPEDVQQAIQDGQLSERHGRALLKAAGKSEGIYQSVAEEVLPLAVEPDAAEKAKSVEEKFSLHLSRVRRDDVTCHACGVRIEKNDKCFTSWGDDVYLCIACGRVATSWEPPATAETEKLVERTIKRESQNLDRATWPLGEVVGQGDSRVRSPTCEGCEFREVVEGVDRCLDRECFSAKEEHWFGYLCSRLRKHLLAIFGAEVKIIDDHGGYDLYARPEFDAALVESGVCAPGKCDKLRFRYISWESKAYIYPVPNLPFIYNCKHSNSHKACRQRFLESQRLDDELAEVKRAEREAKERKAEARALAERACEAVVKALLEGHASAWWKLAKRVGSKPKAGQSLDDSARQVAEAILQLNEWMDFYGWKVEGHLKKFAGNVEEKLAEMGVGLLATVDDLVRRLERISGFVLDEEGELRDDLTWEQVQGNQDNLTAIAEEAGILEADGRATGRDVERVYGWVAELWKALDISREMIEEPYETRT